MLFQAFTRPRAHSRLSKGKLQQHKPARPAGRSPGGQRRGVAAARPQRPDRPRRPPGARERLPGFEALPATADGSASPARIGWQQAIAQTVTGLAYELVEVERAGRGLLRVTIDRIPGRVYGSPGAPDTGEAVTVEDCEAVTRQLQYVLEVEGLDYARLEVSSPGLDRPLRHEADYHRFAGQAVRITLREAFEGRKHWEGTLGRGAAEGEAQWTLQVLRGKGEAALELGFGLDEVREARLVPVLDFKGRKARAAVADDAPAAPVEAALTTAPEETTEAKGTRDR